MSSLHPLKDWSLQHSRGGSDTGDGEGIGGGIGAGEATSVTFYVEVDDPAEALKKIESLGGRIVQDVTVIPGMVTLAQFADPEGNVVGVVASEVPPAE